MKLAYASRPRPLFENHIYISRKEYEKTFLKSQRVFCMFEYGPYWVRFKTLEPWPNLPSNRVNDPDPMILGPHSSLNGPFFLGKGRIGGGRGEAPLPCQCASIGMAEQVRNRRSQTISIQNRMLGWPNSFPFARGGVGLPLEVFGGQV